jgi:multimeric flavodoxin WrbA
MKRILAVIGSPRKGETYKAVQKFEEELKKNEEIQIEYIMLGKYGFNDCTGCHNCINKGQEFCHENLKVRELQDKMENADGVILATPVYNQHVTSLMKKFLDYYTFFWHRPAMFGVKFFGISSGGGMFVPVEKFLKMNTENWGGIWTGFLGVPHYEGLTDKYRKKCDIDFHKKAVEFLEAMEVKDLPKPTLGKLLWFNMWKMNAEVCKEDNPKDFSHWTESKWFNMNYYYSVQVGIIKNAVVKVLSKLARNYMRKVYRGY